VSFATDHELGRVLHALKLGEGPWKARGRGVSVTALEAVAVWVSSQMTPQNDYTCRLPTRGACEATGLSRPTVTAALAVLEEHGIITALDRAADLADGRPVRYRWDGGHP